MGNDGYLLKHEVFLYVFDATLMLVTMIVVGVWHPGTIGPLVKNLKDLDEEMRPVTSGSDSGISNVALTNYK